MAIAECDVCGEHHEPEPECPDPDVNSDEWDSEVAAATTGEWENYSYLDAEEDEWL